MQKEQLIAKFQELYGEGGEIRTYFAPGRVNLIGEHTDYNGGHVFPCALTMGTWAVVRNREDRKLGFFSLNFEKLGIIETSLDELIPSKNAGWTNYPKGVMWAFEKRGNGYPDLWKYSEWFRTFFFRITGSADRTDVKRYIWI